MTKSAVKKLFAELVARFRAVFPHVKTSLKIHAKHFLKSPKPRDFAWFDPVDNSVNITEKALKQPDSSIAGLLAHELGHLFDDKRHKPLSEARADVLAKRALGLPIRYDANGVQNLDHGTTPRPAHLHEAHGYRTVADGLAQRMARDGAVRFRDKVDWVSEHIPEISEPTKFVGWITKEDRVGGKIRNGARPKNNLHCNCGPCMVKIGNPISVQGGEPTRAYAQKVAEAYRDAPEYSRAALPSYRALLASIEKIHKQIASKVKIVYVTGQPYNDDKEMHDAVHSTRIMYISEDFNVHPFFTPAQNLKFRAVHDWFAHIVGGAPFQQRGELQAYNRQAKMTPLAGWPALFTEIVGQACFATTYGTPEEPVFPAQKVALLRGFDLYHVGKMLPESATKANPAKRPLRDLYSRPVRNPCGCGGTCGCC